jgi:GxxExxY protein
MIYHGDTEARSKLLHEKLTEQIIGSAIEEAQLLTYLKLTGKRVGLILNFNVSVLTRGGIIRKVL